MSESRQTIATTLLIAGGNIIPEAFPSTLSDDDITLRPCDEAVIRVCFLRHFHIYFVLLFP
jgi:hypothetical protein